MPEEKKEKNEVAVEEDLFEEEEDVTGAEDDEALENAIAEPTGEAAVTEEEAEGAVAGEAGAQRITLSLTDVPQLEGMNPGESIDLVTTYKVISGDGEKFEVEATDFMPTEEMEMPEEGAETPAPMPPTGAPPAGPGGAPGGGLAGLL